MSEDGKTGAGAADVRAKANTLREAGRTDAAIALLSEAAEGAFGDDAGIRLDLAIMLLAAGRIEEAETIRLPGGEA